MFDESNGIAGSAGEQLLEAKAADAGEPLFNLLGGFVIRALPNIGKIKMPIHRNTVITKEIILIKYFIVKTSKFQQLNHVKTDGINPQRKYCVLTRRIFVVRQGKISANIRLYSRNFNAAWRQKDKW